MNDASKKDAPATVYVQSMSIFIEKNAQWGLVQEGLGGSILREHDENERGIHPKSHKATDQEQDHLKHISCRGRPASS